jgi:hypothetical protein
VNEKQWLNATSPRAGLDYLCSAEVAANRRKAGRRKLRLFVCACARRIWNLIPAGPHREAIELGERLCEGEDAKKRIASLRNHDGQGSLAHRHAAHAGMACVDTNIWYAAVAGSFAAAMAAGWAQVEAEGGENMQTYDQGVVAEERAQVALLREIVGNPFRPLAVDPSWRAWNEGTMVQLAHGIYADRAFDRLPILADALEEAGCHNTAIFDHCRQPGEHVRGCWVVDAVLAK